MNLGTLNIDHCNISGPIPSDLGLVTNLNQLGLTHYVLTGTIPAALSS